MLDYELAKQLKDAGFPFQLASIGSNSIVGGSNIIRETFAPNEVLYLMPTLSELIEACGANLLVIAADRTTPETIWKANPDAYLLSGYCGSTPEEAVARLLLALNKK